MKAIDIHTHAFPADLAAKAIPLIEQAANTKAFLDGTLDDLKRSMDAAGVVISVLQPVSTSPQQVKSINNWIMSIQDEAFLGFGTIHPKYQAWEDELKRLRQGGIKGVKFHSEYQNFMLDNAEVYPIYERIAEHGMIILFHMGADIGFSPPYKSDPKKLAKVLSDFPGLKVIAAHMGSYKMWDAVEQYLVGKDVYLETSFGIGFMSDEQFLQTVKNHGAEKILFGTDSPWRNQPEEIEKIDALKLTHRERRQIFFDNAARLLELEKS